MYLLTQLQRKVTFLWEEAWERTPSQTSSKDFWRLLAANLINFCPPQGMRTGIPQTPTQLPEVEPRYLRKQQMFGFP